MKTDPSEVQLNIKHDLNIYNMKISEILFSLETFIVIYLINNVKIAIVY